MKQKYLTKNNVTDQDEQIEASVVSRTIKRTKNRIDKRDTSKLSTFPAHDKLFESLSVCAFDFTIWTIETRTGDWLTQSLRRGKHTLVYIVNIVSIPRSSEAVWLDQRQIKVPAASGTSDADRDGWGVAEAVVAVAAADAAARKDEATAWRSVRLTSSPNRTSYRPDAARRTDRDRSPSLPNPSSAHCQLTHCRRCPWSSPATFRWSLRTSSDIDRSSRRTRAAGADAGTGWRADDD